MAADGGCERDVVHRLNEGYTAWGALKSVLSNRGLGIKAEKCLYEGVIVLTALYGDFFFIRWFLTATSGIKPIIVSAGHVYILLHQREKRGSTIQYGYRKLGTHARVFSPNTSAWEQQE